MNKFVKDCLNAIGIVVILGMIVAIIWLSL